MSRTAVLTRPADRNAALAARLQSAGWTVLCAPALDIVRLPVPDMLRYLPARYDLIVFVSGNAVRAYADALATAGSSVPWPATTAIAGVGAATLQAARLALHLPDQVREYGPASDAVSYDSESLYDALQRARVAARRVLIVRGVAGREWLADRLRADGAVVDMLPVYTRSPASWPASTLTTLKAWQAQGRAVTWLYTSAEGLDAVDQLVRANDMAAWWSGSAAIVTHPRLADVWRTRSIPAGPSALSMVKVCIPEDDAIFEAFVAV